ncbi:MAG: 3'(2'),5'-bisphosphate nucleotidase CysQ [Candidatus Latescibacteria bacterium]|nr:3'(2'),5'-bisphosphate nucleotidase CysQ [bacterium]MBD3424867.1 3'(2'),5'-bisphosphate nucleotidase CysQ [Candidatus Latescibacterota bacterium]
MKIPDIEIKELVDISLEAGEAILRIYQSEDFGIEIKEDESPLTLADRESHQIIKRRLESAFPSIPLLSEEGKEIPYGDRRGWEYFWLVDPLDGTKEFISRNGEFTVNISLIVKNRPVLGVIYAPVLKTCYHTGEQGKTFKITEGGEPERIEVNRDAAEGIIAVTSRSHSSGEEQEKLSGLGVTESISVGSSLKFCMVAEGRAHLYYRHGPTWEWDTGAGHAIAEGAGASVSGLKYNKEVLKNGSFLVTSLDKKS